MTAFLTRLLHNRESPPVSPTRRPLGGHVEHNVEALFIDVHSQQVQGIDDDLDEVDFHRVKHCVRVSSLGKHQQVVDGAAHPCGSALNGRDRSRRGAGHRGLCLRRLYVTQDRRQRVLQLVGDRSDEPALVTGQLLYFLEQNAHLFEKDVFALKGPAFNMARPRSCPISRAACCSTPVHSAFGPRRVNAMFPGMLVRRRSARTAPWTPRASRS